MAEGLGQPESTAAGSLILLGFVRASASSSRLGSLYFMVLFLRWVAKFSGSLVYVARFSKWFSAYMARSLR